jgi:hypothetical protein
MSSNKCKAQLGKTCVMRHAIKMLRLPPRLVRNINMRHAIKMLRLPPRLRTTRRVPTPRTPRISLWNRRAPLSIGITRRRLPCERWNQTEKERPWETNLPEIRLLTQQRCAGVCKYGCENVRACWTGPDQQQNTYVSKGYGPRVRTRRIPCTLIPCCGGRNATLPPSEQQTP